MNNLIIGNTSQLSYFFPENYESISSRNIDFSMFNNKKYDRIYLLFAEQRTFLNENVDFFNQINFDYTVSVIDKVKDYCNKVVIYSTSELWNAYDGEVSVDLPFKYNFSPYIKSKENLCNYINLNKDKYNNVIIIYPFNFNSVFRKDGFLFGKIFKSLLKNEPIEIGDVNFYRDIIHPKIIVNESIKTNSDLLIGSGELHNIKIFIEDLFKLYNKNLNDYIIINTNNNLQNKRSGYYSKIKYSSYDEILKLTLQDLYEYKTS